MYKMLLRYALLVAALTLSSIAKTQTVSTDLAVTYSTERAQIAPSDCGCFWLQGGSVDAAVTLFHGFGVAANVTGEHRSNIAPGVDLDKFAYMAGPRYTINSHRWTGSRHEISIFGEGLFGGVYGFDSVFPTSSGIKSSASSFSMQLGGGLNIGLARGFGLRALELDYVRTSLPNGGSNEQNDFRIAVGVSYHVGKR